MHRIVIVVVALLTVSHPSAAQRKARGSGGGVPCGRSYIAANKVCHIGTATSSDTAKLQTGGAHNDGTYQYVSPDSMQKLAVAQSAAGAPSSQTVQPQPRANSFAVALRSSTGRAVIVKNANTDLRDGTLGWVYEDHLVVKSGTREYLIPLNAIDFAYADGPDAMTLVIVLRK